MSCRFDEGLKRMKLGLRERIALHVDVQRRKQYDLAGRIASRNVDWKSRPQEWDIFFRRALEEIQRQEREFQAVQS